MSTVSKLRALVVRMMFVAIIFSLGLVSSGTEASAQGGSCAPQDINQACWWDPTCEGGGCYPFGCSSSLCEWVGEKSCIICIQS